LLNDAGSRLSIVNVSETDGYGTATNIGSNVQFIPTNNFLGTATIGYTIMDDLGETNSSTITLVVTNTPPLANPVNYNVATNSVNNVFNPLASDALETPGGSLGLVSVNETDGHGTPVISGTNVLFTPASGFVGAATIGYTITDNVGGTNSSTITANVLALGQIPLHGAYSEGNLVLSWSSPYEFSLQFSTNVAGPYIAIPGASSPYTNLTTTNATGFFRLMH